MKKILPCILILALCLFSCSSKCTIEPTNTASDTTHTSSVPSKSSKKVPFTYLGKDLGLTLDFDGNTKVDNILNVLKENNIKYELDTSGVPEGRPIHLWVSGNSDLDVWSFQFTEDQLLFQAYANDYITPEGLHVGDSEGIQIGDPISKMKELYGDDYQEITMEDLEYKLYRYNGIEFQVFGSGTVYNDSLPVCGVFYKGMLQQNGQLLG